MIDLEKAVCQLPPDELTRFAEWFSVYQLHNDRDTRLYSLFDEGLPYPA